MDYFYCLPEHISGTRFMIEGEEFSHLVHVMRKKEGDELRIVDGRGNAYDARLDEIKKKTASGIISKTYPHHNEPPLKLILAVGVLKNPSKFDFLVEKTTELGVHEIIPMATERTIPSHAKIDRWQKLALAAMKQSGRSFLPHVHEMQPFSDVLTHHSSHAMKLIAHERSIEGFHLKKKPVDVRSMIMLVGPEGGFSDDEMYQAVAAGFIPWYLGERRLRTETAAIVISAMALLESFRMQ